jgi:RimJ/RimL family protein N-acetyltransferase
MSEDALESERLRLVRVSREDALALLAGRRPEGLAFAEGYPSEFSLEVMDLLAGPRQAEAAGFCPWFMLRKDTNEVIGEIGSSDADTPGSVAVGYSVILPMQRQGFATEGLRALIAYLFSRPEIQVVMADTFPEHVASRRVMEKAGMTYVHTIRRDEDGQERDIVVYEVRRGP